MKNITSEGLDPLFIYHLVGALSVFDPSFLEECSREFMETIHSEDELRELAVALKIVKALRDDTNGIPALYN